MVYRPRTDTVTTTVLNNNSHGDAGEYPRNDGGVKIASVRPTFRSISVSPVIYFGTRNVIGQRSKRRTAERSFIRVQHRAVSNPKTVVKWTRVTESVAWLFYGERYRNDKGRCALVDAVWQKHAHHTRTRLLLVSRFRSEGYQFHDVRRAPLTCGKIVRDIVTKLTKSVGYTRSDFVSEMTDTTRARAVRLRSSRVLIVT